MPEVTSTEILGETLSCCYDGGLVIVAHAINVPPSDVEWEAYVRWAAALCRVHGKLKVLVLPGNHSPSSRQRSLYNSEIGADSVEIAVLIRQPGMLPIIKIFAWFIRSIKAFGRDDLPGALDYLGITAHPERLKRIRSFAASYFADEERRAAK